MKSRIRFFNIDIIKIQVFFYIAISLLVFFIYSPSISGEFLFWDDYQNILENKKLIDGQFIYFFSEPYLGMYIPLVYSIWSFIYNIFGDNTIAFHSFNIFLHINNIFLLYLIGKKINSNCNSFWLLAGVLFFALHPLQVETVSWISGSRDLMAALFALLSVYTLLSNTKFVRHLISPVCFFLGLLCKVSIAPLPFIILFVRIISKQKISRSHIYDFSINFLILIPLSVITYYTQSNFNVLNKNLGFTNRLLIALDSFGFYICKLIIPVNLATDYGRTPSFILQNIWQQPVYLIVSVLIIATILISKYNRDLLISLAILLGFLAPVLGIIDFIYQNISTTSDRYIYLPIISISFMIFKYGSTISSYKNNQIHKAVATIFLIFLTTTSYSRVKIWTNNFDFFTDMINKNNLSYSGYQNLARYYFKQGQLNLSAENFKRAYEIQPDIFTNFANYYIVQERLGNYNQVLNVADNENTHKLQIGKQYQPIIWANLMNSLAVAYFSQAQYNSALNCLCEVVRVLPDNLTTIQNLERLKPFLVKTDSALNICL